MPGWRQLLDEINTTGSGFDTVRRKYLRKMSKLTGRNVIAYYSGWMQKGHDPRLAGAFSITDLDINALMTTIHGLDRKKGLDLVLHTPGGEISATESLVNYLRSMFGGNVRAIVPQIAMSAGTMIALSCQSIVMGKHSSLGPIDPQIGGVAAHGIIEEFNDALQRAATQPGAVQLMQVLLSKYNPTLIGECQKAIQWSQTMVREWLLAGMLKDKPDAEQLADNVVLELGDHALTKSHARHIPAEKIKSLGLPVEMLEDSAQLQEAVLSVHHCFIHTMAATSSLKITENHKGVAFIHSVPVIQLAQQP